LILISASQLMPAYDASRRIAASKASEDAANVRSLEAKSAQVKAEQVANAAAEAAGLDREKTKSAEVRLEAAVNQTREAQSKVTSLEKRLEDIKKTLPIAVRWRESLINSDQVLVVSSSAVRPLKLLVSVYDANGTQTRNQFPLTLSPVGMAGSTKESGIGETVKHYFKKGESAEFTDVDATKDFRYNPRKYVSP
jgi:multidrug efflux pump subunit AcrA (membrane-fusion protein)